MPDRTPLASAGRADYGVDAPDVLAGMLATGSVGAAAAVALLALAHAAWVLAIGVIILAMSLVPLTLGLMMVAYVVVGKQRTRDLILERRPWSGRERVLDVGTGAGLLGLGAAKRTAAAVVGIDIWSAKDLSGNSADAIRRNAAIEGVADRVAVANADARAMPFASDSFDRVVSLLCLHNIEDRDGRATACREIVRVLRPGGIAVIGDYRCVPEYAAAFRHAGLAVTGPTNAMGTALSLMWIAVAEKPAPGS